ncbi:MAG: glycosyltransferase involved in cell wall biosynthesis [Luteibaculaceae bacterium]|jgi:glycosyltransferase involved in cell wall biosynthesis
MKILTRKTHPGQFSIEALNKSLFAKMRGVDILHAPAHSGGFWNRVRIIAWAYGLRSKPIHIAGDIHFVGLVLRKNKFTQTVHDIAILDNLKGWRRYVVQKCWVEWPILRSYCTICISEATRKSILDLNPRLKNKLKVIQNPFLEPEVAPRVEPEKKYDVLSIGAKWNKNLAWVAKALEGSGKQWAIVGRPPELDELKAQFPKLNIIGFSNVSDQELHSLYQKSGCLVMASSHEGFGLPILEAQFLGIPVICSDIPIFREVAGEGATLVPLNDVGELRGILVSDSETFIEKTVLAGKNNVKRFNLEETKKKYQNIFSALKGHG